MSEDGRAPGNGRLRVATYNVHSCVGRDRRHDPRRIERVIAELDADVVALQEFHYPADVALEADSPSVLDALEQYRFAYGPTLVRGGGNYGNVLLTRFPIRDVHRIDLSIDRCEPRGALCATLDVRGTEIVFLATHLGLRIGERRTQVKRIVEHLDALESSFYVVAGDFNDWLPGRSVARVLEERLGPVAHARTFPVGLPLLRLDRIWVHPRGALRRVGSHASELARRASDHLPVVAEIDVG